MLTFPVQKQDETIKEKIKVLLSLLSDKGWYISSSTRPYFLYLYKAKIIACISVFDYGKAGKKTASLGRQFPKTQYVVKSLSETNLLK
jgi:hypothetical protein